MNQRLTRNLSGLCLLFLWAQPAVAQTLKPGLWEISNSMQSGSGQMEKAMAEMQKQMAGMSRLNLQARYSFN